MPIQHVKGRPGTLRYVQKKWGVTCDTNRVTPCMNNATGVFTVKEPGHYTLTFIGNVYAKSKESDPEAYIYLKVGDKVR